jgi:hypothetical protein
MNKEALPRELGFAAVQNSLDHTRANFEKNRELSDSLDQYAKNV